MKDEIVKISDPKCMTFGKTGVVYEWSNDAQKYQVDFDEVWIGWYRQDQLEIINR